MTTDTTKKKLVGGGSGESGDGTDNDSRDPTATATTGEENKTSSSSSTTATTAITSEGDEAQRQNSPQRGEKPDSSSEPNHTDKGHEGIVDVTPIRDDIRSREVAVVC